MGVSHRHWPALSGENFWLQIWLNNAVQCRNCALSCHKKCVAKCLASLVCQGGASPSAPASPSPPNPVSNAEALGATLEHRRSAPNAGAGDLDESLLLPSSEQPRRASIQPEIITTSADDAEPVQQVPFHSFHLVFHLWCSTSVFLPLVFHLK